MTIFNRYHTFAEITDRQTQVYVERPFDAEFRTVVIDRSSEWVPMLYGNRQMGKTSLLLKIIDEFTEAGIKSIRVDL
uniref:hypothetical protein n=1 Tax=uncultured Tateyamaria sp. TaxID=455651 RepID=UPI0026194775